MFGGEPSRVWVCAGDFLFLPLPVLRGGGGECWNLLWAFVPGVLGSIGLPIDFLLTGAPVPFPVLGAGFFFVVESLATFLGAGDSSGAGEGENRGEATLGGCESGVWGGTGAEVFLAGG